MKNVRSIIHTALPSAPWIVPAFLLAALLSTPTASHADTVAFTSTAGDYGSFNAETIGYTFTVASSVTVTQLGYYDFGSNGLSASTPVTIWNSGGTPQASATIQPGTGTELNSYIFVKLSTPVTLAAGTYTIGGYATNTDTIQTNNTAIIGAGGITYGAGRSAFGNAYPTANLIGESSYFGPNFQFNAVPEPSTWALLGLGAAGLLGLTLRRGATRA